jgi:hypothetical protein
VFSICYCLRSTAIGFLDFTLLQTCVVPASHVSDISDQADVRFTPKSGHCRATVACPLCAISGHRRFEATFALTSKADIHCGSRSVSFPDQGQTSVKSSRFSFDVSFSGGPFGSSALLRKPSMHSWAGNFRCATRAGRNPKAEAMQLDDRGDHTQA